MTRVTLYSKPDCHLCDIVKGVISIVRKRRKFDLEVRNILDDPADFERFKTEIPVIFVNDQEIARHRLSEVRLDYALDQAESS
jgi:glutaredoxin